MKILPRTASILMLALCMTVSGMAFADPVIPFDPVTGLGGVLAQFMDKTAFFDASNNVVDPTAGGVLKGGEEGRSILYSSNLYENELPGLDNATNIFPAFWTPTGSGEEMTALVYDFFIPGSTAVGATGQIIEYQLGSGSYVATGNSSGIMPGNYLYLIGGKMDVYIDSTPDFNSGKPSDWVPGPPDIFPTASDGTLWMTGSAVPLISDFGIGTPQELMPNEQIVAYWDPSGDTTTLGGIISDPSGDDIPVTEVVTNYDPGTGGGTSHGWFDITGGSLAIIAQDILDPLGVSSFDYDLYFESDILPDSTTLWPANSSDPVIFAVTPEPASMLLFGSAMFGAIAAYRKRKK